MQADLLHVKLALSISFPAGEVILVSLQLLPLLLHASLHLLFLLLHPLKHLHITNVYLVITPGVTKKEKRRQEKAREFCAIECPDGRLHCCKSRLVETVRKGGSLQWQV